MQFNTQTIRRGLALSGLLASLALTASAAFAQQDDAKGPPPKMRERMEERCKADPQKCEEMKKRFEERKAECQKDPAACKQKREERRAKMEERCKADPQKCEEWKKNHPHHRGDKGGPPPAPPAAK
ncbi:MAG TPA: hypothetical protein VL381_07800 [Rhodocyclaceae bacterium]|jgi:hypothetical protein|nr:hypothetical protein [Rhodocyclaceae bacterium]